MTTPRAATSARPARAAMRIDGFNRIHAILGASPACVATHPSDMCVALAALDAIVHVEGPDGHAHASSWSISIACPATRPTVETELEPGRADHRGRAAAACRSRRARPTARCATGRAMPSRWSRSPQRSTLHGRQIRDVRLALGGVAHKPWRAWNAEAALRGAPPTTESFRAAAEAELRRRRRPAATTPSKSSSPSGRSSTRCSS